MDKNKTNKKNEMDSNSRLKKTRQKTINDKQQKLVFLNTFQKMVLKIN